MVLLLDAGGLYAQANRAEPLHEQVVAAIDDERGALITSEAAAQEADYLIGARLGSTPSWRSSRTSGPAPSRSSASAPLLDPIVVTAAEAAGDEWCFRPGAGTGLIPTNDGQVCVFAGAPAQRFADELRHDLDGGLHRLLAETTPAVAARVAAGRRVERVRGFPGSDRAAARPPAAW